MSPFEERKKSFQEWLTGGAYKSKMDELKCDLYSYPVYVPDGQGGYKTVIQTEVVDIADQPIRSPFSVS